MRLGLRELSIASDTTALPCLDERRQFVWMPLDPESALPPVKDAIRIVPPGANTETPVTQPRIKRKVLSPMPDPITNHTGNGQTSPNGQFKSNGQARNGAAGKPRQDIDESPTRLRFLAFSQTTIRITLSSRSFTGQKSTIHDHCRLLPGCCFGPMSPAPTSIAALFIVPSGSGFLVAVPAREKDELVVLCVLGNLFGLFWGEPAKPAFERHTGTNLVGRARGTLFLHRLRSIQKGRDCRTLRQPSRLPTDPTWPHPPRRNHLRAFGRFRVPLPVRVQAGENPTNNTALHTDC
jgi:hypothetical protein